MESMEAAGIIVFFIIGAIMGSFANLVAYRYGRGNTLFFPKKSRCEICKHDLELTDIIPIVSYFINRGRCRYCEEKISRRHPVVEILGGILFAILFWQYGWSLQTVVGCIMTVALLIQLISDLCYGKVLNYVTYIMVVIGILCSGFIGVGMLSSLLGVAIFVFLYAIIYFFSRGTMGTSDVMVAAIVGACVGLPGVLLTFVLSCLMAAIVALLLMVFFRRNRRKGALRFTPFLAISGFVSFAFTAELIALYASLFSIG